MKDDTLNKLKDTFSAYVEPFLGKSEDIDEGIIIKRDHTLRVCREAVDIASSLGLDSEKTNLAEAAALFHDIGRFEQFRKYNTFNDSRSENHAELGLKVLEENGLLNAVAEDEREMIIEAVKFHNKRHIDKDAPCLVKLLRDADKIDIWYVVTEHYAREENETVRQSSLELGLEDSSVISPEVRDAVRMRENAPVKALKTMSDFKLLQAAWIYDLNFFRSYQIVKEREYLDKIFNALPSTSEIEELKKEIYSFLESAV